MKWLTDLACGDIFATVGVVVRGEDRLSTVNYLKERTSVKLGIVFKYIL